jgi:hypothetical protein
MTRRPEGRFVPPGGPERLSNGPVRGEGRRFDSSSPSVRTYDSPLRDGADRFTAPRVPERSFSPPMMREDHEFSVPMTSPGERRFASPRTPSSFYNTPQYGGEGDFMRSFSGSGRQVRGGRGPDGSFCGRVRC